MPSNHLWTVTNADGAVVGCGVDASRALDSSVFALRSYEVFRELRDALSTGATTYTAHGYTVAQRAVVTEREAKVIAAAVAYASEVNEAQDGEMTPEDASQYVAQCLHSHDQLLEAVRALRAAQEDGK